MPEFRFSDHTFSEDEVRKVMHSREGKQLIRLLQQDGGIRLRQAAGALEKGDAEQLPQILGPILQTEEIQTLLKKLDRG